MLTKNFYSYMRTALQKVAATFKLLDGTTRSLTLENEQSPLSIMYVWAKEVGIAGVSFGTGTTPATVSDYALESILGSTQISAAAPSNVSFSRGDTYDEYSVTFGITNITTEAITISEVGLTARPAYLGGSPGYNYCALVDRTVLETPVTIPAGQSKQITYTIRFNY